MSYIGTNKIAKMFLGTTEIAKAYLGTSLVFQKGGGGGELPSGAIPCELVYSTGYASYVDTALTPGMSSSIDAEVCFCVNDADAAHAIGMLNPNNTDAHSVISRSPQYYRISLDGARTNDTAPGLTQRVQRCRMKVSATPTAATIQIYDEEGNLTYTKTLNYTASTVTFTRTFALLGLKNGSSSITSGSFRGGLGRTKYYSDDHFGTLVADFIPCYYNGNFGYWEKQSQTHLIGSTPADIFGFGAAWNTQGWLPNAYNGSTSFTGALEMWRGLNVSPMYEIPAGCTTVRFNAGTLDSKNTLYFFNSAKTYLGSATYDSADKQVSVPANSAYVRICCPRGYERFCYIYDVTNQQYIWKGLGPLIPAGSRASQQQGLDSYGNTLVSTSNGGTHYIYSIASDGALTQLSSFTLSAAGHANSLQFAPTLEAGQAFPYLYVATLTRQCAVLSISASYAVTKVQVITVDSTLIEQSSGDNTQIGDDGYIWCVSQDADGRYRIIKFRSVAVSEGDVTLSGADILDQWVTDQPFPYSSYVWQGMKIKDGKLWFVIGATSKQRCILVFDTATHAQLPTISLTLYNQEYEDLTFWNGTVLLGTYAANMYRLVL